MKDILGLAGKPNIQECIAPIGLEIQDSVAHYLPTDLPEPKTQSDEEFILASALRIRELLKITDGRALVLFTSHRRMNAVCEILSEATLPWTLLKQGHKSAAHLLNHFRQEENSVLLATGSFWEGVDVVGPSLSMVVIDKLPFPSPEEPFVKVQEKKTKERGEDPIQALYIPEMVLRLKQGAGRLLRSEVDWGIIAILDPRAATRYRQLVKEALPPGIEFNNLDGLRSWYAEKLAGKNRETA